jgi:hypothetical protein
MGDENMDWLNKCDSATLRKIIQAFKHADIQAYKHADGLNKLSDSVILEKLINNEITISQVFGFIEGLADELPEFVQLAAVSENGYNIEHINNPTEEIHLAAVTKNAFAIQCIKNPTRRLDFLIRWMEAQDELVLRILLRKST